MKVQAAAISVQGSQFAVVLVGPDLLKNSWEADLTIDRLQPTFGGVPVILMAEKDDGTPTYYGDGALVGSLEDIPLDKMPWKEYTVSGT